jgi:hypothetical protein
MTPNRDGSIHFSISGCCRRGYGFITSDLRICRSYSVGDFKSTPNCGRIWVANLGGVGQNCTAFQIIRLALVSCELYLLQPLVAVATTHSVTLSQSLFSAAADCSSSAHKVGSASHIQSHCLPRYVCACVPASGNWHLRTGNFFFSRLHSQHQQHKPIVFFSFAFAHHIVVQTTTHLGGFILLFPCNYLSWGSFAYFVPFSHISLACARDPSTKRKPLRELVSPDADRKYYDTIAIPTVSAVYSCDDSLALCVPAAAAHPPCLCSVVRTSLRPTRPRSA